MMKNRYIKGVILLGIALIGFSSCQVTNRYKSPKVDSDGLFRDVTSTDTATIADIPWREYFKDRYLQSYIEEGLNNNYDMLIIAERIKQAEAGLKMAKAAYFPDVALAGQVDHSRYSYGEKGKDVLGYHATNYTLGISATWELDIWGKLNRQKRSKYADVLNSYEGKNLIQTSLISNIAATYYSLMALDEQLRVTKEMADLMTENLETTQALKDAGMANGAAVEQTKAALYSVYVSIPDLENSIRQLENTMCVMLGRKPGAIERSSLDTQEIPSYLSYGVPVQALSRRPDVRQAEYSFRSAFELTNAAQASFYPTIKLTSGMIGYTYTDLSDFFKPERIFANIVGSIAQPLFARRQLVTQYKVAKAEQQATLLTFEKTVLAAGQEVSDIMNTYETALKKDKDRNTQVESLIKAVDYTQELQKAGEATYLEVLSAQQSLLQAQLSQISDKLQQLQSTSNLYRALGGGVK